MAIRESSTRHSVARSPSSGSRRRTHTLVLSKLRSWTLRGQRPRRSRGTGSRRVVGVSALGRGTPWADKARYATGSLAMDELIASSRDHLPGPRQPLLHGQRRPPGCVDQGPGHVSLADRRRPQAAHRRHPRHCRSGLEASARQQLERRPRGPATRAEDLSFTEMSRVISEVLGKEVRFQQTTFEAYKDRFVSFGMSEAMAQGMTDMAWAKNEGLDNASRRTAENSTPTSFRQWCQEVLKPAIAS